MNIRVSKESILSWGFKMNFVVNNHKPKRCVRNPLEKNNSSTFRFDRIIRIEPKITMQGKAGKSCVIK